MTGKITCEEQELLFYQWMQETWPEDVIDCFMNYVIYEDTKQVGEIMRKSVREAKILVEDAKRRLKVWHEARARDTYPEWDTSSKETSPCDKDWFIRPSEW